MDNNQRNGKQLSVGVEATTLDDKQTEGLQRLALP